MLRLYGPEWRRSLTRRRGWLVLPWFSLKGYKLVRACIHLVHLRTAIVSAHLVDISSRGCSHRFWGIGLRPGTVSYNPVYWAVSRACGDQSRARILSFIVLLACLPLSRKRH